MLEVGWSEIFVIALILIIVVGPKDLPGMLRNFGRMATRVRGMANEFKGQFDQALREAELDDVRKGLSEVNKLNPANTLRDAINPIRQFGQDIKADLQKTSEIADKAMAAPAKVEDSAKSEESPKTADPLPAAAIEPAATKPQPVVAAPAPAAVADAVVAEPVAAKAKPRAKKTEPVDKAPKVDEAAPAKKAPRKAKPADAGDGVVAAAASEAKKPSPKRKTQKAGDA